MTHRDLEDAITSNGSVLDEYDIEVASRIYAACEICSRVSIPVFEIGAIGSHHRGCCICSSCLSGMAKLLEG